MSFHHLLTIIKKRPRVFLVMILLTTLCLILASSFLISKSSSRKIIENLTNEKNYLQNQLKEVSAKIVVLENEDQRVKNDQLQAQLQDIKKTNTASVEQYERLLKVQEDGANTDNEVKKWAQILSYIGKGNFASASALTIELSKDITSIEKKLAQQSALKIPNVAVNNQAPTSGFRQQKVETSAGPIVVSLIAGDLSTTRVIVDTASASDCKNDCPVLSLGDYVARNNAYAGVNGTYFCPASYPTCADKKNSYDLLVMNKNKTYFNSDNNVYSTNPAVIFKNGSVTFLSQALQWGRDTGIDSMLSNFPLLLSGNEIRFGGDGDPKKDSRGNRSFVANKGNVVYIGVVHGVTVAESAIALKALGMDNALNLDSGGSTALWAGGYKVGPGRAIPNAILFVRK